MGRNLIKADQDERQQHPEDRAEIDCPSSPSLT
jgi:hypothetical protein